ncbi:hypothetical protein SteCoe_16688 [Stentor coeruleus]|uniref:Uncharacterized protein n=1 Tax=Stentor coeruleus TaxID=5963 RepID=A0A1R2C0N5_9CILI|nr:hypothetical protein SteCoe_16688 [Stentor coeruleus]
MDDQSLIHSVNNSNDAKTIYRGSIFFFVVGILLSISWLFGLFFESVSIYFAVIPLFYLITSILGYKIKSCSAGFIILLRWHLVFGLIAFIGFLVTFIYTALYVGDQNCSKEECSITQLKLTMLLILSVVSLALLSVFNTFCIFLVKATMRYDKNTYLS